MSRARLAECLDLAQSIPQDTANYLTVRELIGSLKAELAEHDTIGHHTPAMHAEWARGPHTPARAEGAAA